MKNSKEPYYWNVDVVRRQNMAQAHIRREAVKQKAQQERNQLSQQRLITSSDELYQAILDIDNKCISATKNAALKRSLVSTQMKIRKNVLGQNIRNCGLSMRL